MDKDEEGTGVGAQVEIVLEKKFDDKTTYLSTHYHPEIGGFIVGKIDEGNGTITVEDLLIPEQEVSDGSVDFTPKDLVKLRKEYGNQCLKIIGEWHSHNSMGAFWSSTDEKMMEEFSEKRNICLFIVSSKGRHLIKLMIKKPFKIEVNNLPYKVEFDTDIENDMKKEIETKIREIKYSTCHYIHNDDSGISSINKLEKEINKRVKFFNKSNTVVIDLLYHSYANAVAEEFKNLNPKVEIEDEEHSKVTVVLDTKDKAKEFMVDVKAFILTKAIEAEKTNKKVSLEDLDEDELDEWENNWRNNYRGYDVEDYCNTYNGRYR